MCVAAAVAYAVWRWGVRPVAGDGPVADLARDHLNDLLCLPLFLPVSLGLQRLAGLRRHDGPPRLWEVAQHAAVFSVVFEVALPRLPGAFRSTADPLDAAAYLVGGLVGYAVWARSGRRGSGIAPHSGQRSGLARRS